MDQSDYDLPAIADKEAISHVVNMWTYYRDRLMWDQLRTTFHQEGTISSVWFNGPFELFVNASRKMAENGYTGKHVMGLPHIRVNGHRALSETDVTILGRGKTGSMEVDLTS